MLRLEIYSSPENCPACRKMENIYMELAEEYDTIFIDPTTDDGAERAYKNSVQSMPMIVVFDGGEQIERFVGIKRKQEILNTLKELHKGAK